VKVYLLLLIAVVAATGYYIFIYRPSHKVLEVRYVMPATLPLMDSPAEVRGQIGELHARERVEVFSSTRNWARVRTAGGRQGWVELKSLLDADTFEAGERLFEQVSRVAAQARGNLATDSTLRLDPSRDGAILGGVAAGQTVEIIARRVVARPLALTEKPTEASGEPEPPREPGRDVWYLVRQKDQAGWLIGRTVSLAIPPELGAYAQSFNVVAWIVLNRVADNGTKVPQYVIADRGENQDVDFDRIRVLTWWAARGHYSISFVESKLQGYFPILSGSANGMPTFRLRLVDDRGRKFQKAYALFDTVVRPLGSVDGWESVALPSGPEKRPARGRERRRASRGDPTTRQLPSRERPVAFARAKNRLAGLG
jgi:hypothetical protein